MKKVLTLLFASLLVFIMFVGQGNVASAAEGCGCEEHGIFHVYGAEKNIIVANLISSEEFKNKKSALFKEGHTWNGVDDIQVVEFRGESNRTIMASVPFVTPDGTSIVAVFVNGFFAGLSSPPPAE